MTSSWPMLRKYLNAIGLRDSQASTQLFSLESLADHGVHWRQASDSIQSATVTRKNVAGMDVASLCKLWFWQLNSSSRSSCKSAERPFFSAASKAIIVGP